MCFSLLVLGHCEENVGSIWSRRNEPTHLTKSDFFTRWFLVLRLLWLFLSNTRPASSQSERKRAMFIDHVATRHWWLLLCWSVVIQMLIRFIVALFDDDVSIDVSQIAGAFTSPYGAHCVCLCDCGCARIRASLTSWLGRLNLYMMTYYWSVLGCCI